MIIGTAFVKNAYNQLQITNNTFTINTIIEVSNKFALKTLNRLAYNQKINKFFILNGLLSLTKYHTTICNIKSINIKLLWYCFHKFTLNRYNQIKGRDNFVIL